MPIDRSFYFIRHGQTDWNVKHLCQGSSDIPLNDNGRSQAAAASNLVEPINIDLIVASHLSRAKETAEIINQKLNLPLIVDKRIAERHLGDLEGQPATKELLEILDSEPLTGSDHPIYKEMKIETTPSVISRVTTAFNEHLANNEGKNILFVSHGAVFLTLHKFMFNEAVMSDNAVPYLFEKEDKAWNISKL